jgi:hypothetical protein
MTIIVGVLDGEGGVVMGADSAGVNSDQDLQLRKDEKVFINGPYVIGVCGSWRVNQLLRFADLPTPDKTDPFKFMVTVLIPFVRRLLSGEPEEKERKPEFLISFSGRLFHVYGNLQVSEEILEYETCGCAAQIARGALYALDYYSIERTAENKVSMALKAAQRFSSGVREPFHMVKR